MFNAILDPSFERQLVATEFSSLANFEEKPIVQRQQIVSHAAGVTVSIACIFAALGLSCMLVLSCALR